MKKILDWLVTSSSDPKKTALTVKGFLGILASVVVMLIPILNLPFTSHEVEQSIDVIVEIVAQIMVIVSTAITVIGLVRKLIYFFKPQR